MNYTKGELCACGFPQSHPIPHEHDLTNREKQIIAQKDERISDLYEALEKIRSMTPDTIIYDIATTALEGK